MVYPSSAKTYSPRRDFREKPCCAPAGLLGLLARAHARSAPPNPYPGYMSTTYSDPAHWLCRPDLDDVYDHGLDATAVAPNGGTRIHRFKPARHPQIDCFYIYPTISFSCGPSPGP